jgi:hypothetical protein
VREWIGRHRLTWHGLIAALVLTVLVAPLSAVAAAPKTMDPREIALTPADLMPGFAVDPATSGVTPLPDSAGLMYQVEMRRPRTPEAFADGPIVVQQTIVRLDAEVPAEVMLAAIRDDLISKVGMAPTSEGPSDGGTVTLKRTDGEVTMYAVGFVKQPMVIVTLWAGAAPVTTFPKLIELAGISSARLDQALAR